MKKTIIMLCAALGLTACGSDEPTPQTPADGSMRFEMLHPAGVSRANATNFEEGDRIGLFVTKYDGEVAPPLQISGNWANNVAATLTGGEWITDKKIFWSDQKMDVYGYYPYMPITSIDEQPFSVALDQSVESTPDALGGYEASDFLWAKTSGVSEADESVALQYKHRCSKLTVKLTKGKDYKGDFPEVSELFIHNVVVEATIDFTTGAVTKYLFGEPTTIKARRVDDGTFEAIIVPQRVDSRRPFIELIANGVSYLLEDTFYFRPYTHHTINLIINSNPDQVKIEIGGEVEGGWN